MGMPSNQREVGRNLVMRLRNDRCPSHTKDLPFLCNYKTSQYLFIQLEASVAKNKLDLRPQMMCYLTENRSGHMKLQQNKQTH